MGNEKTYKRILIIAIILFLVSFLFMRVSEIFRMNEELKWIYKYSHLFYIFFVLPLNLFIFIANPIIILQNKKFTFKIIWLIIGLIPFLFYLIIPHFNEDLKNLNKYIWKILFSV